MEFINFLKSNWHWEVIVLLILFVIIRTKVRGFFWRNRKTKEELSLKEFFGLWKKGIEGITPLQQSLSQVWGIVISMVGVVSALVVNVIIRVKPLWIPIEITFAGGLILTVIQFIGMLQKLWRLKEVDKTIKELEGRKWKIID